MGVLDELRAAYENADDIEPLRLPIGSTGGRLVVIYGPPDDREIGDRIMRAVNSGTVLEQYADLDLVINCCRDIRLADPEHPDVDENGLAPLDDGGPVRFDGEDPRLGIALGFTYSTAREAVMRTFKTAKYPLAVAGHFDRLLGYLQGIDESIERRAEEKSVAVSAG